MTKSVYIPLKQPDFSEGFRTAGVEVNRDPVVYSDFVYTSSDTLEHFTELQEFARAHGITIPNYDLCDKQKAQAKFAAAGFTTLDTVAVITRADLENFPHNLVILKPTVSFNGSSASYVLNSAMYRVEEKTKLLEQLDALDAFSGTLTADEPFIAQQVADGTDDTYAAVILSGAVNGQGSVWHCPPIELTHHFKNRRRNVKSVWDNSNTTDEMAALQTCVENLLSAENSKNCFYQLQFLRVGNNWVPHDFQFRFMYYVNLYLGKSPYVWYKTSMIQYAFDMATDKPSLPTTFGLKVTDNNIFTHFPPKKEFITGASKAEVLSALESM